MSGGWPGAGRRGRGKGQGPGAASHPEPSVCRSHQGNNYRQRGPSDFRNTRNAHFPVRRIRQETFLTLCFFPSELRHRVHAFLPHSAHLPFLPGAPPLPRLPRPQLSGLCGLDGPQSCSRLPGPARSAVVFQTVLTGSDPRARRAAGSPTERKGPGRRRRRRPGEAPGGRRPGCAGAASFYCMNVNTVEANNTAKWL